MNAPCRSLWLVLACIAGTAHAAAFDCARAATPVEKLICADAILSQADEDLADAYRQVLVGGKQAGAAREAQRRWLAQDRNRCADLACLRASYARRLGALGTARKERAAADPDVALCERVAEHARRGILDKLVLARSGEQPLSMLGEVTGEPGIGEHVANVWEVDLDGDSVVDRLAIDVQGTLHSGVAYARSGKPGSAVVMLETGDIDQRVLKIDGNAYVLSDDGLAYSPWMLWRLHAQGEGFAPVCTVVPRRERRVKLTAGWGHPACQAALDDTLEPVEFEAAPSVAQLPREHRFWAMSLSGGVAHVDIDNDGVDEPVFSVIFDSSAGRGCRAGYLAVSDEDGGHLPDSWLNQQLLGGIGWGCDSALDIATHEGAVYVDAKNSMGDRSLYRIDPRRVGSVCEFRAAPDYDVPGGLSNASRQGRVRLTSPPLEPSNASRSVTTCPVTVATPMTRCARASNQRA